MEWTAFIKYLSMGYLLYYGLIVIIDLLKPSQGLALNGEDDILEFSEAMQTTIIEHHPENQINSSSQAIPFQPLPEKPEQWADEEETEDLALFHKNINESTGGVSSMQELFKLAQDQSIEIKKQLIF